MELALMEAGIYLHSGLKTHIVNGGKYGRHQEGSSHRCKDLRHELSVTLLTTPTGYWKSWFHHSVRSPGFPVLRG